MYIGQLIFIPTAHGVALEATVEAYHEETGLIIAVDDDGELWEGFEYQVETLEELYV